MAIRLINTEAEWQEVRDHLAGLPGDGAGFLPPDLTNHFAAIDDSSIPRGVCVGSVINGRVGISWLGGPSRLQLLRRVSVLMQSRGLGNVRMTGLLPKTSIVLVELQAIGLAAIVTRSQAIARGIPGSAWDTWDANGIALVSSTPNQIVSAIP